MHYRYKELFRDIVFRERTREPERTHVKYRYIDLFWDVSLAYIERDIMCSSTQSSVYKDLC